MSYYFSYKKTYNKMIPMLEKLSGGKLFSD